MNAPQATTNGHRSSRLHDELHTSAGQSVELFEATRRRATLAETHPRPAVALDDISRWRGFGSARSRPRLPREPNPRHAVGLLPHTVEHRHRTGVGPLADIAPVPRRVALGLPPGVTPCRSASPRARGSVRPGRHHTARTSGSRSIQRTSLSIWLAMSRPNRPWVPPSIRMIWTDPGSSSSSRPVS
jgi:hypothetical protein